LLASLALVFGLHVSLAATTDNGGALLGLVSGSFFGFVLGFVFGVCSGLALD